MTPVLMPALVRWGRMTLTSWSNCPWLKGWQRSSTCECLLVLLSDPGPSLQRLTCQLPGLPNLLGRAAIVVQWASLTLQLLHLLPLIQHITLLKLVPSLLPTALLLLLLLLSKQCLRMAAGLLGPGPSPARLQLLQDPLCPVQQPHRFSKAS